MSERSGIRGSRAPRGAELRAKQLQVRLDEAATQLLVTVGDIAALTGKRPSVVSRWRKQPVRPFPEPVSGGRSPMFNATEALVWLEEHGHLLEGQPGSAWFWRQAVRVLPAATDAAQRAHLRSFVASLVALGAAGHRRLGSKHPNSATIHELPTTAPALRDLARTIEDRQPALRGLLVSGLEEADPDPEVLAILVVALDHALLAVTADASGVPTSSDLLDDALATLAELSPGAPVTQDTLADLIAAITGDWAATKVLDPACGEGALLTRLAERGARTRTLVGIEIDARAARIARIRLALRGVDAEIDIQDAFRSGIPDRSFDAVVIDPPAGDGGRGTSRWLTLASNVLAPGGRAAVVVPAASLRSNAAGGEALRQRRVAAIVLLPPTVRHGVRDTQALALLSARGGHAKVLVVDLSDHRTSRNPSPCPQIARLLNHWFADPATAESQLVAFTKNTHIRTDVIDSRDALAQGPIRPIIPRLPSELEEAVLHLQRLLDQNPDLRGAEKLADSLHLFAKRQGVRTLAD